MSNTKKIKKTISNIFTFILVLAFVSFFQSYVESNDIDKTYIFNRRISIVSSESMLPKFQKWTCVMCENVEYDDVKVGDIIVYRKYLDDGSKQMIIHRVKEKYADYIITKGDNNPSQDPWKVEPKDIISRYKFKITPW